VSLAVSISICVETWFRYQKILNLRQSKIVLVFTAVTSII